MSKNFGLFELGLALLAVILFVGIAVGFAGCAPSNALPPPDSDSSQHFNQGARIPVDDQFYLIKGEVVADVNSLTEQKSQGRIYGSSVSGQYSGYGYVSGSYASWQEGKGFVRIKVISATPNNPVHVDLAPTGAVIIIKTTDQKIIALLPGDTVSLKCRAQYEAVAPVRENETFDKDKSETWELDYCRMVTPIIKE